MKIEISIEKDGEGEGNHMGEMKPMEGEQPMDKMEPELTPEQIAAMAAKIKKGAAMSRAERTLLADYLLSEAKD